MTSRGAASLFASTSTATFRPGRRQLTNVSKHASSSRDVLPTRSGIASSSRLHSRRPLSSTPSALRPQPDAAPLELDTSIQSDLSSSPTSRRSTPSLRHVNPMIPPNRKPPTPESAQQFLTDLLALPSDRQFSPALSIQIVTHKSYRWTNTPYKGTGQGYKHDRSTTSRLLDLTGSSPTRSPPAEDLEEAWFAASNSRLQFLGRRAMATYLPLFFHSALRSANMRLQDLDLLGDMTLNQRIDDIRDSASLGRTVGNEWHVGDVMRWDWNQNSLRYGAVRIKGSVVEAIVGAVFSEFGSPAAQRLFHSRILPSLINAKGREVRDPYLVEKVDELRDQVMAESRGGFLLPFEGSADRSSISSVHERFEDVLGSGRRLTPNLDPEINEALHQEEVEEESERRFATA